MTAVGETAGGTAGDPSIRRSAAPVFGTVDPEREALVRREGANVRANAGTRCRAAS